MDAKQFLKEKGISNNDFMDSGVADLIETLLTEYQALQLQQTGVSGSNIVRFQIEENWGDGCKGFIYFTADKNTPIEKLKEIAENEAEKDWRKICEYPKMFGSHTPFRPTILVSEYSDGKRIKGGISFKTKWR